MPYIGKNLVGILKDARASDTMTGDGSDTTLTLTDTPGSTNNVLVFLDGIRQTPVTDYTVTGKALTFTTAPEAGVLVVALTGSASSIDPKMGSVTASKIVDGMVGNAKIVALSASKLTGALPAISGAALTNVVSSTGIDNVNSDPTISTNPAGGVGTIQLNQVSGEMYVCTDATAGENVWINVGGGSGGVEPYSFQGTVAGYESGGHGFNNKVDKISFTSDGSSTDVANLTENKKRATGVPSSTHGYTAGNYSPSGNVIEKMAYASDSDGTNVGDLVTARGRSSSQASSTNGYMSSGGSNPSHISNVERYSFVSDGNATNIGNVNSKRESPGGHSSSTHGYVSKGYGGAPAVDRNDWERFAFASDSTVTAMSGVSLNNNGTGSSYSSSTHGYNAGGHTVNQIEKFSFSSDTDATDVGDLTTGKYLLTGTSSTTNGYAAGGFPNNGNIEKFSFSSNGNASNIGSLTDANYGGAGHQN